MSANEVVGGVPLDITDTGVVHLLFIGGPFYITREDRRLIYNGKKYKMYFVDTQAEKDGEMVVCRTSFERLLDANMFIKQLKEGEEVQLDKLHNDTSPIYLTQGKTPEEEEEEIIHNCRQMAEEFMIAIKYNDASDKEIYEIAKTWFKTKYIFIKDEINRKYPKPKYREFLKTSDLMENYGKFENEVRDI